MSKLSKVSFLFSGISLVCLILARLAYGGWHHVFWVPLLFFLVLFFLPLVKDGRFLVDFFRMKTTKRGLSMGTMILLVAAILVFANLIAARKSKTWDFSAAQSNTLSPQSVQLVKSLTGPLKAVFFYRQGVEGNEENRRAFRELMKKYQDQSDQVSLDFIEVNERPDLAADYGVNKGSGVAFLEYQGRRNRVEKIDEQEVTGALVKVTREKDKVIYFVVGQGEMDLEETREGNGLNALKMLLSNNRYQVKTLAVSSSPKVPDDADVVAVVGPQQNLMEQGVAALEDYLKRGGGLLIALESKKTAGLERLLGTAGIVPQNNYILNVVETGMGRGVQQGATMATVFSPESAITKVFRGQEFALFRLPMALKKDKQPVNVTLDEIVKVPESSMAFNDMKITSEGPTGAFTLGISAAGTWPGVPVSDSSPQFRLVVYGDADFLSNSLLYQNLNRDLALNTFAALSKEENMVTIIPKDPATTKMVLTDAKFSLFLWAFVVPLPLLLLATSLGLWMRRRFA
ncbi:MAG: GldG family protein [Bdellovibrionaceae bacterium]|nr:GldG family protein [Pseudobdellovibrionaceae bacterium]